jgi:hypothetical protein
MEDEDIIVFFELSKRFSDRELIPEVTAMDCNLIAMMPDIV